MVLLKRVLDPVRLVALERDHIESTGLAGLLDGMLFEIVAAGGQHDLAALRRVTELAARHGWRESTISTRQTPGYPLGGMTRSISTTAAAVVVGHGLPGHGPATSVPLLAQSAVPCSVAADGNRVQPLLGAVVASSLFMGRVVQLGRAVSLTSWLFW